MVVCSKLLDNGNVCGKKLSCSSSLSRHIKMVHDMIKPHACNFANCDISFTSSNDLARHIKYKHTAEKEFKCIFADCDSEFAWKNDLSDHIKYKHNNIRNHECPHNGCDNIYHTNGKLQRHIDACHLNLKPYQCCWDGCDLYFPSPENARRHLNLVHLYIRNFPCPNDKCDYISQDSTHLKSHIKICTNGERGSFGEVKTKHILIDMGVNFRYDSPYELTNDTGRFLRWDFVIPTSDEPVFIEVDGQHHFSPQRFGSMTQQEANDKFVKQQHNDKLKNNYCIDNGYLLLRIKHDLSGEEFETTIRKFISTNLVFYHN